MVARDSDMADGTFGNVCNLNMRNDNRGINSNKKPKPMVISADAKAHHSPKLAGK